MTDERIAADPDDEGPENDLSGRSRMAWNVVASWLGHSVFVVAGFFLPRIIDRNLGQVGLGIWDFGWSLVSYLGIAQVGVGSSVNRYVAKRRAQHDTEGLNRTVSSVMLIQAIIAVVVLAFTAVATWMVPSLLDAELGGYVIDARRVVFLLGLGVTVQMAFNPFVGVITGCHRWDLHNAINGGMYGVTAVAMALAVSFKGGLTALAAVNVAGTVVAEVIRAVVAHRVCPELRLRWKSVSWPEARTLLTFGGKTVLGVLSSLLLYQTNSLQIVGALGAGSLALYTRPMSLMRHVQTFVSKFAFVLTPTASSFHAAGREKDLRELLTDACRGCAFLSIPPLAFLAIMGDPILRLWMGPSYALGALVAVLAMGHLPSIVHQPVWNILVGMNMHGRVAVASLVAGVLSVILCGVALGPLQWGLSGAALALTVPLILLNFIYTAAYACRVLKLSYWRYLVEVWRMPLACALPFVLCLLGVRWMFDGRPGACLLVGMGAGGLVLSAVYWRWAIPDSAKVQAGEAVARTWSRFRGRGPSR
jgi:O-antigen/teichoic acid export membrane protein